MIAEVFGQLHGIFEIAMKFGDRFRGYRFHIKLLCNGYFVFQNSTFSC